MSNESGKITLAAVLTVTAIFLGVLSQNVKLANAVAVDKILWCHYEPNGNSQTLDLPLASLQNAGHMNASGNPLHAGDHAGACATATATATAIATATGRPCDEDCNEPTLTPTATATATSQPCDGDCEPTPTPTATPVVTATPNGDICENIDGIQTSVPEGKHLDASGKNCVEYSVPGISESGIGGGEVLGTSTGQVLGASSMAATGAISDALFNSIFTLGSLLTSFGIMKNGKKIKN